MGQTGVMLTVGNLQSKFAPNQAMHSSAASTLGGVTSRIHLDLIDAFGQSDCPVCRLVERDVQHYIDGFFYESITVVERRTEIRSARGFCPAHSEILAGHNRTLGTAIMMHDVINDVLRSFPDEEHGRNTAATLRQAITPPQKSVAEALRPKRECVLCAHERHQERIVLETLLAGMRDDALRAAFAASGGICLPHLQAALEQRGANSSDQRALLELQGGILRRLRAELAQFIHKHNGSYESAPIGEERRAPAQATRLISGRRGRREA